LYYEKRTRRTSLAVLAGLWIVMLIVAVTLIAFVDSFFRTVPAQNLTSLDWSGYVVASGFTYPQPAFTSVSGSWIVPAVTVSQTDAFSAAWIGIGGDLDQTLIQAGTEQDSISQQSVYSAWYELLPYDSVTIDSINVSAGDSITAQISLTDPASNVWTIKIDDVTSRQSFSTDIIYDSSQLTAEWILERPTVNNAIGTLANFGSITFTNTTATENNTTATIRNLTYAQITMASRMNIQLVAVSSLTQSSSFTATYLNHGS
jgi:hypothetical protein